MGAATLDVRWDNLLSLRQKYNTIVILLPFDERYVAKVEQF
jgi:hypothetical protein